MTSPEPNQGSYQVQDEERLVKRAKERDEVAFAMLYEANFNKIYRYCIIRVGNEMEAEDMAQQVFMRALESIDSYKWQGAPFSAWLFRIAHNQVVDYHRKRVKRITAPLEEGLSVPCEGNDPVEQVEQSFNMAQLATCMRHLTDAQQQVISLRFTSELPITEVAKIMGKSEGAIKALQHSAILSLRRVMSKESNEQ